MMNAEENTLTEINRWEDVPPFSTSSEEAAFWKHHGLSARLMQESLMNNDTRESSSITLRFDPRMLSRIKRMARSRYLNYQSMIKQWLSERLDEEVRKQGGNE